MPMDIIAPFLSAFIYVALILPQIQLYFLVDVSEGIMIKKVEFADMNHLPWPWISQFSEGLFPAV